MISFFMFISVACAAEDLTQIRLKDALTEELNLAQDFEVILDNKRQNCSEADVSISDLKLQPDQRRFTAIVACGKAEAAKTYPIRGRIQLLSEIPVLTRTINPGEVISEADLTWRKIPINKVNSNVLTAQADIIGKAAQHRLLQPGHPLQRSDLKAPKLIKRGELVTVVYKEDGMVIRVQAVAKHDAAKGESITLQSPLSNREIQAVVVAPHHAEITPVDY